MEAPAFIPYKSTFPADESAMISRSEAFYNELNRRRTVRDFSDRPVPRAVIENVIMTASSAPSGAHKQPWTFCVVENADLKRQIREAAEQEEYRNYHGRMSAEWLDDLKPFGTDWHKPFLDVAPYLIIVFRRIYEQVGNQKQNNYYVSESVGIACGFLLAAIHQAGLVALTHTPSPMDFLTKLLQRPANEKPYLLIPVGYPADDAMVPNIERKATEQVLVWYGETC